MTGLRRVLAVCVKSAGTIRNRKVAALSGGRASLQSAPLPSLLNFGRVAVSSAARLPFLGGSYA